MSTAFYVSYAALWVLVIVQGMLLLLVYRHFGMMTLGTMEGVQRDGLGIGDTAPSIYGASSDGSETVWESRGDRPALVVFAATDCEPCSVVMPVVDRVARARSGSLRVLTVVPGPADSVQSAVAQYGLSSDCLGEDGSGVFDAYRVRVTPFAFVIGEDGVVRAKGLCSDPLMLRDLLAAGGLDEVSAQVDATVLPTARPVKDSF
ncbi:MAG: TlpA family protein disulfide reductase [Actinomycetota bacterium]|nr:TlpA family protein disulfide reductase [Actinomycetota bacterium]